MQIEVDAALFDSDGVLVDSHIVTAEAWTQVGREFGLDFTGQISQMMGVRALDTLLKHLPPADARRAADRLEDLEVEYSHDVRAMPGAVALTTALPDGHWTIVTSATDRLARVRWNAADIPIPDRIVVAEDVVNGKPHPEPFLAAARILGFAPSRCVVFEDSPNGGEAARAAGAAVVAVGDHQWGFEPDARIPDLGAVSLMFDGGAITLRM